MASRGERRAQRRHDGSMAAAGVADAVPVTRGRARSSLHKQTTLARPTSMTCHAHGHGPTLARVHMAPRLFF